MRVVEDRTTLKLEERLPELKAVLKPEEWEWYPNGDNYIAAYNWSMEMENGEGIWWQYAMRFVWQKRKEGLL